MKPNFDLYFPGMVQDGVLTIETPEAFAFYLDHFTGQKVEVRIRKLVRCKSKAQNNYFQGVVVHCLLFAYHQIGEDYTEEEVKQLVKDEFLSYEKNGKRFTPSWADVDMDPSSQFIYKCIRRCAQMGVVVPPATTDPWWKSLMPLKRRIPRKSLDRTQTIR